MNKILSHGRVVLWMVVIFCFSAQPGDLSSDFSDGFTHLVMSVINQLFSLGWEETKVIEMTAMWDYPIRKLAHMTEFGILAGLMLSVMKYYKKIDTKVKSYCVAWAGAVLYAVTDEFHQRFVPDRSGNWFDVCVDATGALIGLLVIWAVARIWRKFRKR